jgi:CRISPR-associated protein Csa1
MYYIALKDVKENVLRKLQDELDYFRNVSIRGWNIDQVKLPAELSGKTLPVNLLASGYCPTNRDVYLKEVLDLPQRPTWPSYKGRLIHKLLLEIARSTEGYIGRTNIIRKVDLLRYIRRQGSRIVKNLTSNIRNDTRQMSLKPTSRQKKHFIKGLLKIVRMESEIASCLLDYLIATNLDVNLPSEFSRVFPFHMREISLNAMPLGFSPGAKPDFIYKNLVVGEIKTGEVKEFHKLTIAAYALAYEYDEGFPINFGAILNVDFTGKRTVPIYKGTELFVVSDKYRLAFLNKRNKKFEIVVKKEDPGKPANKKECSLECPYYVDCWGS